MLVILVQREMGAQITQIPRMEEFMKVNLCFFLHPQGEGVIFPKQLKIRVIRVIRGYPAVKIVFSLF